MTEGENGVFGDNAGSSALRSEVREAISRLACRREQRAPHSRVSGAKLSGAPGSGR